MKMFCNHYDTRELLVTSLQAGIADLKLKAMPTVCLINASSIKDRQNLLTLIKEVNDIGCIFYLTCGAAAEEIHDLVDKVIETGNEAWLEIATTSHKNEDFEDVAWFFLNATYVNSGEFRCLAFLDEVDDKNSQISTKLLELHLAGKDRNPQ